MSTEHGVYIPEDSEITRFSTGHRAMVMTVNDNYLLTEDPWLGSDVIERRNSPLMYDFYTTVNAFRAGGVSQLCKSRESSTIPNLASFDRRWGLIGQSPLVERFGAEQGLNRDHINAIHIKVEGSDQAHTAFSHKLELAIQKWGGPENAHERMWPLIARLGGTTDVLDKHQVRYDAKTMTIPGFDIPEWAEAQTREDIDLDRLQYIATEGLLWFDNDSVDPEVRQKVRDALSTENFEVTPEGKLAFKNADSAIVVSKLLMLFSTEHWNDPLNRAHLHLGIHGVQRSVIGRRLPWMDEIDKGQTRDPINYFHGIDSDFTEAFETGAGKADDFIYLISTTLNASGMEERRKFIDYRLKEYCQFIMDDQAENYPSDYLEPKRVEFGPRSSSVHTEVVELTEEERNKLAQVKVPQLDDRSDGLTYTAGPLKNRYIDPLVRQGEGYVRLSEAKPVYARLLQEHQHLQTLGVKVSFSFNPDYAAEFRAGMTQNDESFRDIAERSEMTPDQRRRVLEIAAKKAIANDVSAGRLILKRELSF